MANKADIPPDLTAACRTAVSRADLVRFLQAFGTAGLSPAAAAAGYEKTGVEEEPPSPPPEIQPLPETGPPPAPEIIHEFPATIPPASFLLPVHYRWKPPEERQTGAPAEYVNARPLAPGEMRAGQAAIPPWPELVPWSRLWPFLRLVLGEGQTGRRIDWRPVIRRLARLQPLFRLPRRSRRNWAHHARLILDFSPRLRPFWTDQQRLRRRLERLRGRYGLDIQYFDREPGGRCRGGSREEMLPASFSFPPAGTPVLIATDCGLFDADPELAEKWRQFGWRLRRAGVRPVVLCLAPPRLWRRELADCFHLVRWDWQARLPRTIPPGSRRAAAGAVPDPDGLIEALLVLCSAAVHVEPALLRALRLLLAPGGADSEAEAKAWNHPGVQAGLQAMRLRKEKKEECWRRFSETGSGELRQAALAAIRRWHGNCAPVLQAEEDLLGKILTGESAGAGDAGGLFYRVARTFALKGFPEAGAMSRWLEEFARYQLPAMWGNQAVATMWAVARRRAWRQGEAVPPEGLDLELVRWALADEEAVPREWDVWQRGDVLDLRPAGAFEPAGNGSPAGGGMAPGSFVTRLTSRDGLLTVKTGPADYLARKFFLATERTVVHIGSSHGIWLSTDHESLRLEYCSRPTWARSIGRDRYGLWLEIAVPKPDSSQEVYFRLRWMPPGRFAMGSPEFEPEREDDEIIHDVILTHGYWMGETPCTQDLWQAVMNRNPSRFKGVKKPVENISWEDCQIFIKKINERIQGLELQLPTEAQWEYGCRAGTRTPFSFGEQITPELANFSGHFPYTDGMKGEFRNKTVEVMSFPPNRWGLYEMHGNVWEWCNDWYGNYTSELAVNPIGQEENSFRILRGGSWINSGKTCRSAFRAHVESNYQRASVSFRLSRGPIALSREEQVAGQARRKGFPAIHLYRWRMDSGEDEYGPWVDFACREVPHRLRWIEPGRFLMGSPADEPERDNDETQHEVTLISGFWLGETACTQELWQAVTGSNPSHFKGSRKPVENVSWDDCQEFLQRINGLIPGLELCLPTEAQWEYACRAGTSTPFSFGNQITPDQVNYHGNYPYAGGKKGKYRQEPVEVKSLPPNPWGLYEMHGNVYEWCADWFGEYLAGPVTDPAGPETGARRVLRGGSWFNYGRNCRSARRLGLDPGDRINDFGFRLSRGPFAPSREKQEEREAGPGQAERSGAGQARREGFPAILLYRWMADSGEDSFGPWVEFAYRGITHRLRWVTPGQFMMGSPLEEPERNKYETQHKVILSKGFWLGETTCTQELWEIVMGQNPSRFKGARRPVEMVSWNDCKKFLNKLNGDIPGLDLDLPTEAQWEYACRAGSSTPFSFGTQIDSELVNYDGNKPYAEGKTGQFRQETVDVKSLPPSSWGFYEMHGNVWEWCSNGLFNYSTDTVTDPAESSEQQLFMMVRGGSWHSRASACRSACRDQYDSYSHHEFIGFRIFRSESKSDRIQIQTGSVEAVRSASKQDRRADSSDIYLHSWEKCFGEDSFGRWLELSYREVRCRMRWIPPGRFWMGSPNGEPERDDNEVFHEVILTRGFWLGETACTQELWQAVMGGNPSHFKNPQRPVENVSWDDCQEFLKRINELIPGLELYLPTEAQWEYVCRAGRKTPYSFGNKIMPDQVNCFFRDADEIKSGYRRETVEVKTLPPNPWGIYEMHGNVWEWCTDWYGEYPSGPVTDPAGPKDGIHRIYRGGAWSVTPNRCRSAERDRREPGRRYSTIGFRLCGTTIDQA